MPRTGSGQPRRENCPLDNFLILLFDSLFNITKYKRRYLFFINSSLFLVPRTGIEPVTRGFSVPCSTNWAIEAYLFLAKKKWRPGTGSNRRPLAWQASVLTNWTTGPPFGGNNRARTCDPLLVRQMLSQLSYAPITLAAPIIYQIQTQMSILFFNFF